MELRFCFVLFLFFETQGRNKLKKYKQFNVSSRVCLVINEISVMLPALSFGLLFSRVRHNAAGSFTSRPCLNNENVMDGVSF